MRNAGLATPSKEETREEAEKAVRFDRSGRKSRQRVENEGNGVSFAPVSPGQSEIKKRRTSGSDSRMVARARTSSASDGKKKKKGDAVPKKRVYYKKVVYDGGEFEVGDDVYVKRREDTSSDDEDPEIEECRICFKAGRSVMIECDICLGGFHLKCLAPPLKEVPEGDWNCGFCEAQKLGKEVELPKPPEGKKMARTAKEKLLSSDLWAAHIERYGHAADLNTMVAFMFSE